MKKTNYVKKLVFAAMCLALCLVLPFLTMQIPEIGSALLPMHIPVLLCGFICGPWYGLLVGIIAPLLRHVTFGMPPLITAIGMTFELGAYGLTCGLLYKSLPRKNSSIYVSLIAAMIIGRVIWGLAMVAIMGITNSSFTMAAFMGGAFLNAIPGIIIQIVVIPLIIMALQKAKLISPDNL